jgi:DNA polymerase elongation subunit (family B)
MMTGKVYKEKVRQQFKEMCQKYFGDDGPQIVFKEVLDERILFSKFRIALQQIDPDIITGWNVDYFDVTTMENRAKNQQYSMPDYRIYSIFDLMKGYDRMHTGRTYKKLEYVAQTELGVGKLPRDKIHIMFKNDKEKLCLYNIWDVELCRRIDIARNVLVRHLNFAWFAGADLDKTHYSEPLLDKYILHEIGGKVILPSKDMLKKTGIDKGALVAEPVKGRFNLVAVLDFASMYPNSIISCNISPETQIKPNDNYTGDMFELPSGRKYYKSPPGFIPIIVSRLMNMRKQVKNEMKKFEKGSVEYKRKYEEQTSIKYFVNSAYGIVGSESFRLADGDVASDVTHLGRVLIQYTMDKVKEWGYTVLYADTDSVYFQTGAESLEQGVEIAKDVEQKLNILYKEYAKSWNGSKECTHNIKCEKIYQTWLQAGVKKRHCGLVGWDYDTEQKFIVHLPSESRLDVKGFEIVRANASKLTKRIQKEVIITALESENCKELLIKYLRQLHSDFYAKKYDLDMLIPGSANKEEYKVKSAHVRAIDYSMENNITNLQKGDPYTWMYVQCVVGKPQTDVVALDIDAESIPDTIKIDYEKMWERSVASPLSHILGALDIDLNMVVQKQRQTTLF